MVFPLNWVCVRLFINLDRPALGGLLILLYRVCPSFIQLWSMVSVLTSTYLILLLALVRMMVDPTAPSYVECGWDEAYVFSAFKGANRHKHVLNGATVVSLVMTALSKLGPSAQGFLQSLANLACCTGVVDLGSWLRIAQQYLSCALVPGQGIGFRC